MNPKDAPSPIGNRSIEQRSFEQLLEHNMDTLQQLQQRMSAMELDAFEAQKEALKKWEQCLMSFKRVVYEMEKMHALFSVAKQLKEHQSAIASMHVKVHMSWRNEYNEEPCVSTKIEWESHFDRVLLGDKSLSEMSKRERARYDQIDGFADACNDALEGMDLWHLKKQLNHNDLEFENVHHPDAFNAMLKVLLNEQELAQYEQLLLGEKAAQQAAQGQPKRKGAL